MKIVSRGTLEHQKAPTGEQSRIFIDLLALPGLTTTMILTIFGSKNMFFRDPKNDQKTGPSKIIFFRGFLRFLGLRAHDFHRFWVPKVTPGARFSRRFPVIGLKHVFSHFL